MTKSVIITFGLLASGCTVVGPSAQTYPVTVQVYQRSSESPLSQARVLVDGRMVCTTGQTGDCIVQAPGDRESCVSVEAPGYHPSDIWCATVTGPERWSFYLERE